MPKIKQIEEDYDEEDEVEEVEQEERGDDDEIEQEEIEMPKVKSKKQQTTPKQQKMRFGIVAPESMKLIDIESKEVIGEGEYIIVQALANILERLERIEAKLGVM